MQAADECVSHMLVLEGKANDVVRILEDSGSVVDDKLRKMCSMERKDLDVRQGRQLCHSLKAIGVCQ